MEFKKKAEEIIRQVNYPSHKCNGLASTL
jgi:hypothetical protein